MAQEDVTYRSGILYFANFPSKAFFRRSSWLGLALLGSFSTTPAHTTYGKLVSIRITRPWATHLSIFGILDPEAYRFRDAFARQDRRVDLQRRDLLPATIDELFETTGELQVTRLVYAALIARAERGRYS